MKDHGKWENPKQQRPETEEAMLHPNNPTKEAQGENTR
jgi:hypothetical protein